MEPRTEDRQHNVASWSFQLTHAWHWWAEESELPAWSPCLGGNLGVHTATKGEAYRTSRLSTGLWVLLTAGGWRARKASWGESALSTALKSQLG